MSIIQTIREKGAKISVILIALALLGFILTDYVAGKNRGGFGGGSGGSVGSVNGKKVSAEDFGKKVKQQEDYKQQQGYPQGDATTQRAVDDAWEQEISTQLFTSEFDKLGMRIGKKELGDILYGPDAPEDIKKQFTDQATGQYNPVRAKQEIDQMLKKGSAEQKENFNNYVVSLEQQRMSEKYISLLTNSINYPRWYQEKQNSDNSLLGKISLVRVNYTDSMFVDSTIKITDEQIAGYIKEHKDQFKQTESRSISYVTFSAAPSVADSAEAKKTIMSLKAEFDKTADVKRLVDSAESSIPYSDRFVTDKEISSVKDSLIKKPVGSIYGPYIEGANYVIAKLIATRLIPDTVKVRHILIATAQMNQQTRKMEPVRDSTEAKKQIDSIQLAIKNGANFDTLCKKLSEDPGSSNKGGVYDSVGWGRMVPEFNDFIFLNKTGDKGVVKTEFGYHYIEILFQRGSSPAYKVAYLTAPIVTSQETDSKANNDANQFAGESRDQKSFEANVEKYLKPKGISKAIATNIKPTDAELMGLGASRQFVKDIYAARVGEVLKPAHISDKYVVAIVTETLDEGTQSVAKARAIAEIPLRNKKKAEILKQKAGKLTTLEAVAAAWGGKKIETVDSLRMSARSQPLLGYEPKVIGAVFNPANKGKLIPEPIEGTNGLYAVRVENISATAVVNANVAEQRKAQYQQAKQYAGNPQGPNYPLKALRNAATIKDKRADKY